MEEETDRGLKQETPEMKEEPEEQSINLEPQHSSQCIADLNIVCVKKEEFEPKQEEDTEGEDVSAETEGDTDHSSDWRASSDQEDGEDKVLNDQPSLKHKSAPVTSENSAETKSGDKKQLLQCPFCAKMIKGSTLHKGLCSPRSFRESTHDDDAAIVARVRDQEVEAET
uniref:Uncharacterized protein n=1 Tax=Knipowitschia caucasica TaxID=637954 RepID=A0AAV2JQL6_KNICA